ncbi:MAG: DUF308 domain-containing protein [Candidatus Saccharimonadales bacterium]
MAKQSEVYMFDEHTKNMWWVLVLTGLLSVIFGFVAIIWPGITIGVLALLLAVYIGITGIADIVSGIRKFSTGFFAAALTLLVGLLFLGVSVYLLSNIGSGLAVMTLVLLIALSFIVRGVVAIVVAFADPDYRATRWLNVVVGSLSVLAGLVVAWYPSAATLAWVWVIGFFALVSGAMQIGLGFTAKDHLEKGKK